MLTPTSDDTYLKDQEAWRKHEQELARIDKDKQTALAKIAKDRAESRHAVIGGTLAGLAVLTFLITIVLVGFNIAESNRKKSEKIAEKCIERNMEWDGYQCLRPGAG